MAHMLQKSQLISTYGAAEVQSQSGKRCIMGATEVHNLWHVCWTLTNLCLCSILLSAWFKMRVENGGQLDGDGIWCNHLERKSEIDLLPCKWMFWVPANVIHILEEKLLLREDINWKKTFSFRHCPNYLNPPPPWPQFGQLGPLFRKSEFKIWKSV